MTRCTLAALLIALLLLSPCRADPPTLVGDHIVIQDNQGTALVLEPGRTFKQVGKDRIGTEIDRWWPVLQQERVSYAPPVCDGGRLYIRGERALYCIGEK